MASQQDMLNSAYSWYAQQGVAPEAALELAIQAVQAAGMKESKKQPRSVEDIFQTDVGAIAGASTPGAYLTPQETFIPQSQEEIEATYAPQLIELRTYAAANPNSIEAKIYDDIIKGVPYTQIVAKLSTPGGYPGLDVSAETQAVKFQEYAAFAKYIKSQKDEVDKQLGLQSKEFTQAEDAYTKAGLPKPVTKGGPRYEVPTYQPRATLPGGQAGAGLTIGENAVIPPELQDFYSVVGDIAAEKIPVPTPSAAAREAKTKAMKGMVGPSLEEAKTFAELTNPATPQGNLLSQAQILQENRRKRLYDELAKRVAPIVGARTPYTDAMKARLQVGP